MMTRLRAALARLEDHWLGDLLGTLALAVIFVGLQFAGLLEGAP